MQEQDETRTVDRRRLLRRAGTVAAGAAGATVVAAAAASPAQAAPGDQVTIDAANTGDGTTKLTAGTGSAPTLHLENDADGAALRLTPNSTGVSTSAPAGSVFVDEWGDFAAIGDLGDGKYVNWAYSATWASMPIPVSPFRWVDTRSSAGRSNIVAGSASYDSAGRLLPKGSNSTPDMIIDLSSIFAGGYGAVQINLTVTLAKAPGHAALWDSGNYPGTSSINYPLQGAGQALANFTQTLIAPNRTIRLKTNQPAAYILDIVGFVLAHPSQLLTAGARASSRPELPPRKNA